MLKRGGCLVWKRYTTAGETIQFQYFANVVWALYPMGIAYVGPVFLMLVLFVLCLSCLPVCPSYTSVRVETLSHSIPLSFESSMLFCSILYFGYNLFRLKAEA